MSEWGREERVKLYLGYVEVEMTIMGILSAFCVAAAGFLLKEAASGDKGFMPCLWSTSADYLILGSTLLAVAALWFYRERSALAWHHGQLCLSVQHDGDLIIRESTKELLESADSWENWVHYHRGFAFVSAGFCELLSGLAIAVHPRLILHSNRVTFLGVSLLIALLTGVGYLLFCRSLSASEATADNAVQ